MNKYRHSLLLAVMLLGGLFVCPVSNSSEGQPSGSPAVSSTPPEDPMYPMDISAWTYTPEFADQFRRQKLADPGPKGALAVNFRVHQVEELDRCVFNVFLDNKLPIDYPEGPVGFLPLTYPASWAFLQLTSQDREAIETAYLVRYRQPRAALAHSAGREPLAIFQYRAMLYADVAVLTLTADCQGIFMMKGPLVMQVKMVGSELHGIVLPDNFPSWIDAVLTKRRRREASLNPEELPDRNVWTYVSEFGKRFGKAPLNEAGLIGAQAVAWRVEQHSEEHLSCFLDVYLDDGVATKLPEGAHGYSGLRGEPGYFLGLKDRSRVADWFHRYLVAGETNFFVIREMGIHEGASGYRQERIEGNLFRLTHARPFIVDQYRVHALPHLSYISFDVGCIPPPEANGGIIGLSLAKTDGKKHDIILPDSFVKLVFQNWRERVDIPVKCRTPKLFPGESCDRAGKQ
jgi:hypothetical protein